jgi:acetyl esterase/lipase
MLRLILIVIFLLVSLLCLFRAPEFHLWYVSILVTEFPWVFMGIMILLLGWGFGVEKYSALGTVLGMVALIIFASPVVRAYFVSADLDKELDEAFGKEEHREEKVPFSAVRMITGIGAKAVEPTNIIYSTTNGKALSMDFYASEIPGKRPCVIIVHGGSWSGGDNKQLPELNWRLARLGYHVASIDYRLAPQFLSPAPVEDVKSSLDYLRRHAHGLNIDTGNFVLLGRSAGGQIVLAAAYALKDPGIKGVISFYGPADMVWGYQNPANPLVLRSCEIMECYLGGTYTTMPEKYEASSAMPAVNRLSVPTLLIHGKIDPLVAYGHSTRLKKKLEEYKVPHFLLTLPWGTHGCDYTLNGPGGQLSTYTVERFLREVIR